MSIDGHIDDACAERLILSSKEDFEYLDEVRARCDAVLVGAGTMRADNPRLRIRSVHLQEQRLANGLPSHPTKVTVTTSGKIDADARFFDDDGSKKIVYTVKAAHDQLLKCLQEKAEVIALGEEKVDFSQMFNDLASRGIQQLLVEGGTDIHTQCMKHGLADELQVSIAPFFVGHADAPRFVHPSSSRYMKDNPMKLHEVLKLGDVVLLRYLLRNGSES